MSLGTAIGAGRWPYSTRGLIPSTWFNSAAEMAWIAAKTRMNIEYCH